MPSSISWLDSTAEEQRAARELIGMFSEKESRDELGIGPIRDAFSDLLFPGTSVLQTRARYYLFVPWCYTTPDARRLSGNAHRERGRNNERALIKAMRASDMSERTGLIGARAGVNVRNLPSDIYWNGMRRYGIREHRGGIGSLALSSNSAEGTTELVERVPAEWNRTIPSAPAGFPSAFTGDFTMTPDEAAWLREQIIRTTEGSLLAQLLDQQSPLPDEATTPWLAGPESQFEELHHARLFSVTMRGAALLYNLLIAERFAEKGLEVEGEETDREYYEERLDRWHTELKATAGDLSDWDLDRMWAITKRANPRIHPRTQEFVTQWVEGVKQARNVASRVDLRGLVEQRERRKGAQSRLKNEKMLAAWSGASGTGQLLYRWGSVKVIVNDILRGVDIARS